MEVGRKGTPWDWTALAILACSFSLKLWHLGHTRLTQWDEAYHAIVARNLLHHPLTPTLVDRLYLRDSPWNWTQSHIWLHKPILPLWEIAISFRLLGVNTLALRMPSALLSTLAAWLTYQIGVRLLDRRAAFIAATLQAFFPAIMMQVQGYLEADVFDTSLIFYTELGIYFVLQAMERGHRRYVLAAGVGTGLAYLSKSFLGLIVLAVALAGVVPHLFATESRKATLRIVDLALMLLAMVATILPWTLWCYVKFRQEFLYETVYVLRHLRQPLEGWEAPWYRAAYSYLLFLYGWTYLPALVAVVVAIGVFLRRRDMKLGLLLTWCLRAFLPNLLSSTKTPWATAMAIPPVLLLIGWLLSSAFDRDGWMRLIAAASMLACVIVPPRLDTWRFGMPSPAEFGSHPMQQAWWVVIRLGAMAAMTCGGLMLSRRAYARTFQTTLRLICLIGFLEMAAASMQQSYKIAAINASAPSFVALGRAARHLLPADAVLLVDEAQPPSGDSENIAFRTFLPSYPLAQFGHRLGTDMDHAPLRVIESVAERIRNNGGVPFVVSRRPLPCPTVVAPAADGYAIYRAP